MKVTIQYVQNFLKETGYYKDIKFLEEEKGDCVYFEAKNNKDEEVTIRADIEYEVGVENWNIYESSEEWDWTHIDLIYKKQNQ